MSAKLIELNDGNKIPQVGLGVYQASPEDTLSSCLTAFKLGYRHIDTAALYGNEVEVGQAIKSSGIPRDQIYVTTKLWNTDQGYESALKAFDTSLQKLGLDYVDLYLIHSPVEGNRLDSWRALEKIKKDGRAKSIGVSNYGIHHLREILDPTMGFTFKPVVNQVEMHPFLYETRSDLIQFCRDNQIVIEAYSPLTRGKKLNDRKLQSIASKYGKTTARILLRWCVEMGFVTLPKSVKAERIGENFALFDWSLQKEDVEALNELDKGLVVSWNPLEWD